MRHTLCANSVPQYIYIVCVLPLAILPKGDGYRYTLLCSLHLKIHFGNSALYVHREVLIGFNSCIVFHCGLPKWSCGKESACQCRTCSFHLWVGKILWRRKQQPIPVFLPGKSHGWRNLVGYSPWGTKELDIT